MESANVDERAGRRSPAARASLRGVRSAATVIAFISGISTIACSHEASPAKAAATVLSIGDSYTIGEGVAPEERWPIQLAELLGDRGVSVEEPRIIARTGWTTDDLREALRRSVLEGPYELITLLVGVNDQFRGGEPAEYRQDLDRLIDLALPLVDDPSNLVMLSIPDYGATPFGQRRAPERIAREIDAFNAIGLEIARKRGLRYVEITELTRERGADRDWLAPDELHPSGRMYLAWARLALDECSQVLGR